MSKKVSHRVCLSVTLIESVFKMDKIYFPQVFLKECKLVFSKSVFFNVVKENKMCSLLMMN